MRSKEVADARVVTATKAKERSTKKAAKLLQMQLASARERKDSAKDKVKETRTVVESLKKAIASINKMKSMKLKRSERKAIPAKLKERGEKIKKAEAKQASAKAEETKAKSAIRRRKTKLEAAKNKVKRAIKARAAALTSLNHSKARKEKMGKLAAKFRARSTKIAALGARLKGLQARTRGIRVKTKRAIKVATATKLDCAKLKAQDAALSKNFHKLSKAMKVWSTKHNFGPKKSEETNLMESDEDYDDDDQMDEIGPLKWKTTSFLEMVESDVGRVDWLHADE